VRLVRDLVPALQVQYWQRLSSGAVRTHPSQEAASVPPWQPGQCVDEATSSSPAAGPAVAAYCDLHAEEIARRFGPPWAIVAGYPGRREGKNGGSSSCCMALPLLRLMGAGRRLWPRPGITAGRGCDLPQRARPASFATRHLYSVSRLNSGRSNLISRSACLSLRRAQIRSATLAFIGWPVLSW
jgi:hypothetical protein